MSTLDQMPSWYNARGRLDRSACIEIRVSEVRRLAGSAGPKPRIWPDMRKGRLPVLPHERPARTADGRVATGRFTVTAEQLHALQSYRLPRQLAGDRRTIRANTMRPPRVRAEDIGRIRRPHNAPPDAARWDVGLNLNPNRGAGRTKIIGLTADWSQPLRIEKWQYPHRIRPAYFLICPGWSFARRLAALSRSRSGGACTDASGALPLDWLDPELPPSRDPRFPPLSVCGRGRKDPQRVRCPQRCYKLLLVQCTPAEAGDADAALAWVRSLPARVRDHPPHRAAIARVLDRYAPILPPRVLLCPRCCGVRYGNDPENARQSWRRLAGKPDALPAKRIVTRSNNHEWTRRRRKAKNKGKSRKNN